MGWYGGSIGDFRLLIHDSVHDHVKDKQSKEYYENYLVDAEFKQLLPGFKEPERPWMGRERNKNEWDLQIPLLMLGNIFKLKKNYRFEWNINLDKLMWEEIEKRGFIVEGYISIGKYCGKDNENDSKWNYFYLTSKIGEKPIKLETPINDNHNVKKHIVNNYYDHYWLMHNGLEFFTEIVK